MAYPVLLIAGIFLAGADAASDVALQEVFARVAERGAASIVTIVMQRQAEVMRPGFRGGVPPNTGPYYGRPRGPASGVVISASGHVLASEYRIGGDPGSIDVIGPDGSILEAILLGRNPGLDLVLLEVEGLQAPPIPIASGEQTRVGQSVIVVGRSGPGDEMVVTTGIVSALGRMKEKVIQVDAGIHPGNLGGAVLNLEGKLIGVPGLFHRRVGWNSGVGLAAPARRALEWARTISEEVGEGGEALPPDDLLEKARLFENRVISTVEEALSAFVKVGGASGVVISSDGEILTNYHVAGGETLWEVTFPTGDRYRARLLGTDSRGDLALMKIEGGKDFPHVDLGDGDDIRPGRFALAFGKPFGIGEGGRPTVTLGVISAIHRYQGDYGDSIQVDTSINPGNSGGPLLDLEGKLIGICGRMAWRPEFATRTSTGAGFAIPVTQIRNFLPILRKEGVDAIHGEVVGLHLGWGAGAVVVQKIDEDSPAEAAGFEESDVILRAADQRVTTPKRCRGILSTYPAGTAIQFRIRRGDRVVKLTADLGGRPYEGTGGKPREGLPEPFIGITYGRATMKGVEVWKVAPGSPAAKAGVKKGDWITSFAGRTAEGPLHLEQLLLKRHYGDAVELALLRGGKSLSIEVRVINSLEYTPPEKK